MPNLIKKMRRKAGFTQEKLADKVGVTQRTIVSLEKEKYKPSVVLAYKLAKVFGTDIETLFCLKDFIGG